MKKLIRPILFLAGLFVMQQSVACADEPGETLSAKLDCRNYCAQAENCNGDINRSACENDCQEALNECRADEVDEAQDRLDECADETCDDFTACTIDAGAQCFFGL